MVRKARSAFLSSSWRSDTSAARRGQPARLGDSVPTRLGNGSVSFTLTNYSDMSFTVLASTNLALPFSQWSNLGTAVESPLGSGQYPFMDMPATNYSRRF